MKKYFDAQDARKLVNIYKFAIFPVHGITELGTCTCGSVDCSNAGKHPATLNGFKDASNDIEQVKALWNGRQGLNCGIATGQKSGVFVIDIDSKEGYENLKSICKVPKTFTVKTAKGYHLYFKYPGEEVITKTKILDGVDVRGDGGYVVAPLSHHKSGFTYTVQNELEDFADAPTEILNLVVKSKITDTEKPQSLNLQPQKSKLHLTDGWSIDDVKSHLNHIDPDLSYDDWIKVGMAIQSEGLPFSIWDDWSSKGSKYDKRIMQQHWNSFKGSGVSYGTVVHFAKGGGWKPEQAPVKYESAATIETEEDYDPVTGEVIEKRRLPLLYASDVQPVTQTKDFIEDLLCENEFSVVYGESNCGKTFFMLDLAMHVALGKKWRDKNVEQGGVIYAALEGGHGTRNRISAFKEHYQIEGDIPLAIIPSSINFLDRDGDIQALVETIREAQKRIGSIKMIVIDTLARAMSGADENSNQDMGALVISADLIRSITGAHISFVHHSGKDVAKGARGHSSLRAAVDTEIEISRENESAPSKAKVVKQREMEMMKECGFTLEKVILGVNQRRKEVSSCVVKPTEIYEKERKAEMNASETLIYNSLLKAIDNRGKLITPYKGSTQVKAIDFDTLGAQLIEDGYRRIKETKSTSFEDATINATAASRYSLKKQGKINFTGSYIWIN